MSPETVASTPKRGKGETEATLLHPTIRPSIVFTCLFALPPLVSPLAASLRLVISSQRGGKHLLCVTHPLFVGGH